GTNWTRARGKFGPAFTRPLGTSQPLSLNDWAGLRLAVSWMELAEFCKLATPCKLWLEAPPLSDIWAWVATCVLADHLLEGVAIPARQVRHVAAVGLEQHLGVGVAHLAPDVFRVFASCEHQCGVGMPGFVLAPYGQSCPFKQRQPDTLSH